MNLRNNATNARINEPSFIFGLTNLRVQVYEICVFGIPNLRINEPYRSDKELLPKNDMPQHLSQSKGAHKYKSRPEAVKWESHFIITPINHGIIPLFLKSEHV